jgi:hypothetical protein
MAESYRATAEKAAAAAEALVAILFSDPRVQRVFETHMQRAVEAQSLRTVEAEWRAELASVVRDDLRRPDYSTWLPPLLFKAFAGAAASILTNTQYEFKVTPGVTLEGRSAKNKGREIERDVKWLYLAELADPPISLRRLGREHRSGSDAGRRAVQLGIERAKAALEVFAVPIDPLRT